MTRPSGPTAPASPARRRSTPLHRVALAALAAAALTAPHLGCSLMGYGIGSSIDTARARRPVERIAPGTTVEVKLRSGESLRGVFHGSTVLSPEEYETRYRRWRESVPEKLRPPALGDRIDMPLLEGGTVSGRFAGLRTNQVVLSDDAREERVVAMSALGQPWRASASISQSVASTFARAPRQEVLLFETTEGNRFVGAEEIRALGVARHRTGRWFGTLIGAAGDALIIAVVVSLANSPPLFSFQ